MKKISLPFSAPICHYFFFFFHSVSLLLSAPLCLLQEARQKLFLSMFRLLIQLVYSATPSSIFFILPYERGRMNEWMSLDCTRRIWSKTTPAILWWFLLGTGSSNCSYRCVDLQAGRLITPTKLIRKDWDDEICDYLIHSSEHISYMNKIVFCPCSSGSV